MHIKIHYFAVIGISSEKDLVQNTFGGDAAVSKVPKDTLDRFKINVNYIMLQYSMHTYWHTVIFFTSMKCFSTFKQIFWYSDLHLYCFGSLLLLS